MVLLSMHFAAISYFQETASDMISGYAVAVIYLFSTYIS